MSQAADGGGEAKEAHVRKLQRAPPQHRVLHERYRRQRWVQHQKSRVFKRDPLVFF